MDSRCTVNAQWTCAHSPGKRPVLAVYFHAVNLLSLLWCLEAC